MQPPDRSHSGEALQGLLAVARRYPDGTPPSDPLLRDPGFREAVLAAGARHAIPGLVLVAFERRGLLDEMEAGQLRLLRRQAARWDLERERVLRRLSGSGIPALVLKGAALRATAYDDPAEREFTDLDLLVAREEVESGVTALAGLGYQRLSAEQDQLYLEHHHHLIVKHPQGFVVELHWGLEPPISPFRVAAALVREGAVELPPVGGLALRVPRAEHMVLHLAHQNLENGFAHLRRLVDVDRCIARAPGFDWGRLGEDARAMRIEASLALTLRLAERLLWTEVPAGFVTELGVGSAARRHLAMLDPVAVLMEQRGERREVEESLLLWCLPRGARLKLLADVGTGRREWFWREVGGQRGSALGNAWALVRLLGYQVAQYRRIGAAGRFWRDGGAK